MHISPQINRSFRPIALVCLVAIVTLAGCIDAADDSTEAANGQTDEQVPDADDDEASGDVEPVTEPGEADVERAATSTGMFGFDMFYGLVERDPDGNVVTSPYSAAVLLMLLLNGADGETREAIGNVLRLDDPFDDSMNQEHQALADYLTAGGADVELAIANSLWANEGNPLEDDYASAMQELFDAHVEDVDLGSQESADQIDQWVSDQTNDMIQEMAEDLGLPDANVILILLNAVYFLGDWTEPFDPELTEVGAFAVPDGSQVEVAMMQRDGDHLWAQQDGFKVLRLPYGEEERFGMEIFLPDEDRDIADLRTNLDQERWRESLDDLNQGRVDVRLPSFELEYSTGEDLNDVLKDLGMAIAYEGTSDFTPMTATDPWLDTVVQKTFIRVDEEGTEAAAVTGGVMEESMPPQFHADRPFMFTISDLETGTILFLGQVNDPTAGE